MICKKCRKEIPGDAVFCCYCATPVVQPTVHRHRRGNGAGTARKRGRTWQGVITIGWEFDDKAGKRKQIRKAKDGFKTKTEALAWCSQAIHEYEDKKVAPHLKDYWGMYAVGEMKKLSADKQKAYQIAWKKCKSIHLRRVDTLTVADLRAVVGENTSSYYPARDMKVVLNHLFKLAGADGWVSKDLPSYIILPELNEKKREPFTQEEQKALWQLYESGVQDAAIPLVMIYTGMMPGEFRKLEVENIDFENQMITGAGMKTAVRKESPIYLPDNIIPVLQQMCDGRKGRILTCNEEDFYIRYYAVLEKAECRRLTPYSCRHTTATALAITENIAPQTVAKVMRWSSSRMLDRYAHPDDPDARAAINKIAK